MRPERLLGLVGVPPDTKTQREVGASRRRGGASADATARSAARPEVVAEGEAVADAGPAVMRSSWPSRVTHASGTTGGCGAVRVGRTPVRNRHDIGRPFSERGIARTDESRRTVER